MRLELIIEHEDGKELRIPLNDDVQHITHYKDNGEIDYMDLELLEGMVVSFGKEPKEQNLDNYDILNKFPIYED